MGVEVTWNRATTDCHLTTYCHLTNPDDDIFDIALTERPESWGFANFLRTGFARGISGARRKSRKPGENFGSSGNWSADRGAAQRSWVHRGRPYASLAI
jgi:hypothetical protein